MNKEFLQLSQLINSYLGKPAWDYQVAWPDANSGPPIAKIFVQWDQDGPWELHGNVLIAFVPSEEGRSNG